MGNGLRTSEASTTFEDLKPRLRAVLASINARRFEQGRDLVSDLRTTLASARELVTVEVENDDHLADLFVLDRYVELCSIYGALWQSIIQQRFSASWNALQDALDSLRLIKRFSQIDVLFFEDQLLALEQAYPYKVFFSVGMTVKMFECSLCGKDIDSEACLHRRGHLYSGEMAYGIARAVAELDHVSVVTRPEDKRCVASFEDTAEQFGLIRYVSELTASGQLRISDFTRLHFSKRIVRNPHYVKVGRNCPCFCGSGKKFKRCCISKEVLEGDHAEVVAEARNIEQAVA
jgi:hypothetical protein